jgi:hypothetical protein
MNSAIHQEMSCKDGKLNISIDACDVGKVEIRKNKEDLTIIIKSHGVEV